jgi:hypothetical protein
MFAHNAVPPVSGFSKFCEKKTCFPLTKIQIYSVIVVAPSTYLDEFIEGTVIDNTV